MRSLASWHSCVRLLSRSRRFVRRACSAETWAARCWSSQKPGFPSSSSSSATSFSRASGSKVITDPGELGPDLLELLVERLRCRLVGHEDDGSDATTASPQPRPHRRQAPWQRLNFLPLPHQHGSLRPILSRSEVTRCWVATEPPPAPIPPAVVMESPSPPTSAPAPAAAIA